MAQRPNVAAMALAFKMEVVKWVGRIAVVALLPWVLSSVREVVEAFGLFAGLDTSFTFSTGVAVTGVGGSISLTIWIVTRRAKGQGEELIRLRAQLELREGDLDRARREVDTLRKKGG
jgi:hypothetical protein